MLRSYIKIALRNLLKRKDYSILNVVGLAIGIACCLLIFQYVSFEKSYDNFLPNGDRTFRLSLDNYQQGNLDWQSAAVYAALGPTMKKDFPEIEDFCRLSPAELLLSDESGKAKFTATKGYYADASFLSMFNIHVIKGDTKTALVGLDRIMLSVTTAKKYFGNNEPLGKVLVFHSPFSTRPFLVTGIFDPLPVNSHLAVNYLISYPTVGVFHRMYGDTTQSEETSWGWYQFYTYLLLKKGTDPKKLEAKFPAFCDHYINSREDLKANNIRNEVHMMPVTDIHLHSHFMQEAEANGNARTVSFFFMIAFFIIGIAWVNFINLATARSLERCREVGVRKVIGAKRISLVGQFLIESTIINLVSFLLALVITFSIAPLFNLLTGQPELHGFHLSANYWLLAIGLFLAGSFLAGIYPAFVLSAFKPVIVLKGWFRSGAGGAIFRKALVVAQFVISVVLITGTFIVYRQLDYMRSQPLGMNMKQTLVVAGPFSLAYRQYESVYEAFKDAAVAVPGVKSITASSGVMGKENSWANDVHRVDPRYPNPVTLHYLAVDYDFIPSYELKLVAGRNFSRNYAGDSANVILNEAAVHLLGFESPQMAIGEKLGRGDTMTIIGVIGDYHNESLNKNIDPLLVMLIPSIRTTYSIKLESAAVPSVIAALQTTWDKFFPNDPFSYYFLDQSFDAQYRADRQFGKVFGFFAALAIVIACVGLTGLSAYNVLQRRKEVGIRKVLGASVVSIVNILSKQFLRLVLVAIMLGSPLCWIIMNKWLQNYAYRVQIRWWMPLITGVLAVFIALLTVGYQTIKAAIANPVRNLRTE